MPSLLQAQVDAMNERLANLERDRELLAINHSHSGIAGDGQKVDYPQLTNFPNTIVYNRSWGFPHDITSGFATIAPVNNSTHTVTSKKVCYITGIYSAVRTNASIIIDGKSVWEGNALPDVNNIEHLGHFHHPYLAATSVESDSVDITAFGFECNTVSAITPLTIRVETGTPYTVPTGKILVILNVFMAQTSAGFTVTSQSSAKRFVFGKFGTFDGIRSFTGSPTFLDEGDIITKDTNIALFSGYLIDK